MAYCPYMSAANSFVECSDGCALYFPQEWGWTFQGKPTWGCAHKIQAFKLQEIQTKTNMFSWYKDGDDASLAVYDTSRRK